MDNEISRSLCQQMRWCSFESKLQQNVSEQSDQSYPAFAKPKNDLSKVKFLGIEKFKTVSIFSFDMDKTSLSTTLPTYSIRGRPKRHFLALSLRPLSLNL